MRRKDGRTVITVGKFGNRVAVEDGHGRWARLRFFVDGEKCRISVPGLRLTHDDGAPCTDGKESAEVLATKVSQAIRRRSDPMAPIREFLDPPRPVITDTSLHATTVRYFLWATKNVSRDCVVNYRAHSRHLETHLGAAYDLELLDVSAVDVVVAGMVETYLERASQSESRSQRTRNAIAREKVHAKRRDERRRDRERAAAAGRVVQFIEPADDERRKKPLTGGVVACEKALSFLFMLGRWAAARRQLKSTPVRPPNLGKTVRTAWSNQTSETNEPQRLLYSPVEAERLLAPKPDEDPRVRFLVDVATGTRMGQSAGSWRSDLDLANTQIGHGMLTVPDGSDKKRGVDIDLSARALRAVKAALTGYLKPLERAYKQGRIKDYPLVPGGDLAALAGFQDIGCPETIAEAYLGDLWDRFEQLSGVKKVEGRRWYGLRRRFRTAAAMLCRDRQVLDRLMGHRTGGVGAIYEDPNDPVLRRRCLKLREQIWTELTKKRRKA